MLCHFCQNLVFVPFEEISVQNADWLTGQSYLINHDTSLVSEHQPSRKALELSASRGCRVCAMFWFQLFYDTESGHARHDNDPRVAPILLSMKQLTWGKDCEPREDLFFDVIYLHYEERLSSLRIEKPVSGITNEHV